MIEKINPESNDKIKALYIISFRSIIENEMFDEKYKVVCDNPRLAN